TARTAAAATCGCRPAGSSRAGGARRRRRTPRARQGAAARVATVTALRPALRRQARGSPAADADRPWSVAQSWSRQAPASTARCLYAHATAGTLRHRMPQTAVIVGAGPAGLAAAHELLERTDVVPIVLEVSELTRGIARTVNYRGNRIDIGGHRFFSKSDRVMEWWLRF